MLELCCNLVTPSPIASPRLSPGAATLAYGAKTPILFRIPSILGLLLQWTLHLPQWSLLASHGAKPQLLSMSKTSNPLENSSPIAKSGCPHEMQPWPLLDHSSCVLALKESFQKILPQRFCFHLTTTHFSAPDDKQQFPQQSKGFTLDVLGLLAVTADSSFQADQNLRFLTAHKWP